MHLKFNKYPYPKKLHGTYTIRMLRFYNKLLKANKL